LTDTRSNAFIGGLFVLLSIVMLAALAAAGGLLWNLQREREQHAAEVQKMESEMEVLFRIRDAAAG